MKHHKKHHSSASASESAEEASSRNSEVLVAEALLKHFPKDAVRIVEAMGKAVEDCSDSNGMKRRMGRVAARLEKLRTVKKAA